MHNIIEADHSAADLRAGHFIADLRVDMVCEIQHRSTGGERNNVALRSEHEHLVRGEVGLYCVSDGFYIVCLLLALKELPYPVEALLAGYVAGYARLVLPVSRNAVLRGIVHFHRAYLHLERDTLAPDNCGVQRLIAVRLRSSDIVLEAVRNRPEHIVDNAEHVVALDDRLHYNANRVNVVYLVEALVLHIHLLVYAVDRLYPALDDGFRLDIRNALPDALFNAVDECVALLFVEGYLLLDFLTAVGVEIVDSDILHLLLDVAHT